MPLVAACGTGIVKVIGLWNFRRLGSTVSIGLTATRFPRSFVTSSGVIGWAWKWKYSMNSTYNKKFSFFSYNERAKEDQKFKIASDVVFNNFFKTYI